MGRIVVQGPKLAQYQRDILEAPERYTVTEASTKSGKTASHILWLFMEAMKGKGGFQYWWVAPTYAQAEMAFRRMRAHVKVDNFFSVNETKLRLALPNGAVISFRSADRPDNLYGDDVHGAVFDEFTRAREDSWFSLRSTLTATNGKCKLIGNVRGKKNWGWRLAQKARNGELGYKYFKITCYDAVSAGILKDEEIEQAKRDLPEHVFNELYLAEASEDGACPFDVGAIRECELLSLSMYPAVCLGVDLAKSVDWTVVVGLDFRMRVCYFERFQSDWRHTTEKLMGLPRVPMMIDSTGVGDPIVEELQKRKGRNVIGYKFSNATAKQQLMEGLSVVIQKREVGFPRGIISEELESFEYEYSGRGVKYAAPVGQHDDCVCALALAVDCFRNHRNRGRYDVR